MLNPESVMLNPESVMLNPESVMLNLFQHLFRAVLVQHLTSRSYKTLKSLDPESSSGSGSG
jgi:hypothetical protein